jgi:hypothetical protein
VGKRQDGTFWAIDGQHRKLAADKRTDIVTLPCEVFEISGIVDEARKFRVINTARTGMKSVERFKADCVAEDALSLKVKQIIEGDGYRAAHGGGQHSVGCVSVIAKAVAADESAARAAWGICAKLSAGEPIVDSVFDGLFYLERHLRKTGDQRNASLADRHNLTSLLMAGLPAVRKRIAESRAFYAGGGAKVYAAGIVNLLNHGRSTRRIEFSLEFQTPWPA